MPSIGTAKDSQGHLENTYLLYVTLNNLFFSFFKLKKKKKKDFEFANT